jgi:hypothetical protein
VSTARNPPGASQFLRRKILTIQEAVLKQVAYLRQCQNERKEASIAAGEAAKAFKKAEAIANLELTEGIACDASGVALKLTNDVSRRGYIKAKIATLEGIYQNAKEAVETANSLVEVERSVLSAIKDLRGDAELDISHLTKYDI